MEKIEKNELNSWTDLLAESVKERYENGCSTRYDFLPLARAKFMWDRNINFEITKEETIFSVYELLKEKNCDIDLSDNELSMFVQYM